MKTKIFNRLNNIAGDRLRHIKYKLGLFILIFILCGVIYYSMELIWRGYSHYSMFLCAGVAGLVIMFLNDHFYNFSTDFRIQSLTAGLICSIIEYGIGEIFNRDYSIWDYRGLWGTISWLDNQVNILFVGLWIVISCFAIPFLDYMQWKLGLGKKPWYRIGKRFFYPWEDKE